MARRNRSHAGGTASNRERWLLPYSDMITLLLALFIVLFSISQISKVKFSALAHEMSGGFGGADVQNRPAPAEKKVAEDTQSLEALAAALQKYVRDRHLTSKVHVHIYPRGVVVSLTTDSAMFASGSAILEPKAGQLVHSLAGFLLTRGQRGRAIKIEGNTDNVPISTPLYPTNWDLSTARAVAVTRHLSEHDGITPSRLSAIGLAEWHPLARNDSEQHRLMNRRVDIVVLRNSVQ